jgi:hypothetical protein
MITEKQKQEMLKKIEDQTFTSVKELRSHIRKSGVRVYIAAWFSNNVETWVEAKKADVLFQIKDWDEDILKETRDNNSKVSIDDDGHVYIG